MIISYYAFNECTVLDYLSHESDSDCVCNQELTCTVSSNRNIYQRHINVRDLYIIVMNFPLRWKSMIWSLATCTVALVVLQLHLYLADPPLKDTVSQWQKHETWWSFGALFYLFESSEPTNCVSVSCVIKKCLISCVFYN